MIQRQPTGASVSNPLAEHYARRALALTDVTRAQTRCLLDIPYGDDPRQKLDIYKPDVGESDLPVLIFLHGGGFADGDKAWCGFMAGAVVHAPAILICASYRLTPAAEIPEIQADAAAIVRWVLTNVAAHGGSPGRVHIGGHSAGAAIAAAVSLRPDLLTRSVAGTVCVSGSLHAYAIAGTPQASYSLPAGPLQVSPDAPLALVDGVRSPFLLAWGGRERQRERVERSSMAMIGALCDQGADVQWLFLPDADHFDTHLAFSERDHPWSIALRLWLNRDALG